MAMVTFSSTIAQNLTVLSYKDLIEIFFIQNYASITTYSLGKKKKNRKKKYTVSLPIRYIFKI